MWVIFVLEELVDLGKTRVMAFLGSMIRKKQHSPRSKPGAGATLWIARKRTNGSIYARQTASSVGLRDPPMSFYSLATLKSRSAAHYFAF